MNDNFTSALYFTRFHAAGTITPKAISAAGKRLLGFALRELYGLAFSGDCPDLAFGAHGKPYFADYPEIHFNISHSGAYVVAAVSDLEIGADIQEMRITDPERLARTAKRVIPAEEYDSFLAAPDRRAAFFREWTLREAYVKWTGEGITRDLRGLPLDGWHTFVAIDPEYVCAVQAAEPLKIIVRKVDEKEL